MPATRRRPPIKHYFNTADIVLWSTSVLLIVTSFLIFDRNNYLTLLASLIGVTSLILNAKGNPIGQALIIAFALLYAYISYDCAYYGEMLTYVGMTAPMALFALISWLRNPFKGRRSEVAVGHLKGKGEIIFLAILTAAVTVAFYFILAYFNTANLIPSTVSVTTSFVAVYLTFRRSAYFAVAYALNDIVLIVLWVMAAVYDPGYISVIVCFVVFLFNDVYGFISWQRMAGRQRAGE